MLKKIADWFLGENKYERHDPSLAPDPDTVNDMIAVAGIPRPETLMAQMIAFKIAQIPADPGHSSWEQRLEIKLADGRYLEVRCKMPGGNFKRSYHDKLRHSASVGCPGGQLPGNDDPYRSVDLNEGEEMVILNQFKALVERSKKLVAHQEACKSQDSALNILEGLL